MAERYRDGDWPHGLRCGECSRLFEDGMPISEQIDNMIEDIPCVVPVCVPCGLEKPVRGGS